MAAGVDLEASHAVEGAILLEHKVLVMLVRRHGGGRAHWLFTRIGFRNKYAVAGMTCDAVIDMTIPKIVRRA